jgi:hypothetical protein
VVILAFWKERQKDLKFDASLNYIRSETLSPKTSQNLLVVLKPKFHLIIDYEILLLLISFQLIKIKIIKLKTKNILNILYTIQAILS